MVSLNVNGLYGGMGMEYDKARKLGRRRWTERQVVDVSDCQRRG